MSHKTLASKQASKVIYTPISYGTLADRTVIIPAGREFMLSPGRDCFVIIGQAV